MEYDEALAFIHSRRHGGPDLGRMRVILDRLGAPDRELKFVHVAGTNGKGSVCAYMANILRCSGYKTGLFTSPFVRRFNERIQVNGEDIPDTELAHVTETVRAALSEFEDKVAEFELVTLIGLTYFAQKRCDIVVLEVGMGGVHDATNVIEHSEVSAMTAIGLDHTQYLGNTVEEIAKVKAGIIKDNGRCVAYTDPGGVIEKTCRERNAAFTALDLDALCVKSAEISGTCFDFGALTGLKTPLLGSHQPKNAALALTAAEVLKKRGWKITGDGLRRGIATVVWPGRFELLRTRPNVIIDGGHNPQAVEAAIRSLDEYFPGQRVVFVLGVMADKDVEGIIERLAPVAESFICVEPPAPRALKNTLLAKMLTDRGLAAETADSVAGGVAAAVKLAGESGTVCVLGSLYILEEARAAALSM